MVTEHKYNFATEVPVLDIPRDYARIPKDAMYDWTLVPAELSKRYHAATIPGMSENPSSTEVKRAMLGPSFDLAKHNPDTKKLKEDMIAKIKATFDRSAGPGEFEKHQAVIEENLEDPGAFESWRFHQGADDEFFIAFHLAIWEKRMADAIQFLHGYGPDLSLVFRRVPDDCAWGRARRYDAMSINERLKARRIINTINIKAAPKAHPKVTWMASGNISERLYGLPKVEITAFDNGEIMPPSVLFMGNPWQANHLHFYHENLFEIPAKHQDLFGTQDLAIISGAFMYFDEKLTASALSIGRALLKPGGMMVYDYLIMTPTFDRILNTEHWDRGPFGKMTIHPTIQDAISNGLRTLESVNANASETGYLDLVDVAVNIPEPWDATSVQFTVVRR